MTGEWQCECCGEWHSYVPLCFAVDTPSAFAELPLEGREERSYLDTDLCVIDGEQFFVRGLLQIPILGETEPFVWNVWAKLNRLDFDAITDTWEQEGRELVSGPFRCRLANELSLYPGTCDLPIRLQVEPLGKRPLLFLEESAHSATFDQQHGITAETAARMSLRLLHGK